MNHYVITALVLILGIGFTVAQPPNPLDTNVFGYFIPILRPIAQTQPNPLQIRLLGMMMSSAWEPWSQYTPTTKGFFIGDAYRRPALEHTLRNKNTAIAYAIHKLLYNYFPANKAQWDSIVYAGLGLPVNNGSTDPSTPMGLANLCVQPVLDFFDNDNWNSKGDRNGNTFNRIPYLDYTGYEPLNSPYDEEMENPDRWVPLIQQSATFYLKEQVFVTPQAGLGKTFAVDVRANQFKVDKLQNTWKKNRSGYIAQAEQLIEESANLDDRKKMVTEFFDNKFVSFGTLTRFVAGLALDRFVIVETLINLGLMDGISLMWYHKPIYDGVRPISAIRFIKEEKNIQSWGGPYQGTVTMKGRDWNSYLTTDNHPEYPSGTTCLCSIFAEVIRKYDNTDIINFSFTNAQGSSVVEPGFTPAQNLTFGWTTLTELVDECGHSRMWGGVHFPQAINEAKRVCTTAGTAVYNKLMLYLTGSADATPRQ